MSPQDAAAKFRAGYRPPSENMFCMFCGAVGYNCETRKRYFCARHQFYVHSHGYCPAFGTERYVAPDAPKPSPFKQQYLFKEESCAN